MKELNLSERAAQARLQMEIVDHFDTFTDTQRWTVIDGDAGASVAQDADGVGGLMLLTTGATDNNEAYLHTTNELFDVLQNRPIFVQGDITYTEANTDDANVIFGLANAVAANHLVDDGAGPLASYSGAVIFKADGDTVWSFETSVAGAQTTTASTTAAGGAQTLSIDIKPTSSTNADCFPRINGEPMLDTNGKQIRHSLTYTSVTEMNAFFGVKAGSANSEVLTVKSFVGIQKY